MYTVQWTRANGQFAVLAGTLDSVWHTGMTLADLGFTVSFLDTLGLPLPLANECADSRTALSALFAA
jgi:hypothetical protein